MENLNQLFEEVLREASDAGFTCDYCGESIDDDKWTDFGDQRLCFECYKRALTRQGRSGNFS